MIRAGWRGISALRRLNAEMRYEEVVKLGESDRYRSAEDREEYRHAVKQLAVRKVLLQRQDVEFVRGASPSDAVHVEVAQQQIKTDQKVASSWYSSLANALFLGGFSYVATKLYRSSVNQVPVKEILPETVTTKFSDVQGMDEVKAELLEVVDYLKDSKKYVDLGVSLPRGLLLTGEPGTGKTLLARAIAGEAGVKFFYSSGSEFEEVYVGLGAKRIRELFREAKANAPCVVFIDEIDSIGGTRKNDQYAASRQSLNQLLVEMDGFDRKDNVVVIAATNLPRILDQALRRAGRFDKEVHILPPDRKGREAILRVYMAKIKVEEEVSVQYWAKLTTGTTGADLSNFVNTAALHAIKASRLACTNEDFSFALDRLYAGIENRTLMSAEDKLSTAIHEIGHVLSGLLTRESQQLHKVTILSRGQALGYTVFFPHERHIQQHLKHTFAEFDVAMGGHTAEEMFYGEGEINTGCTQDMRTATSEAYKHVRGGLFNEYTGMGNTQGMEYMGHEYLDKVDQTVRKLLDLSAGRTRTKLGKHKALIQALAERLVEKETLSFEEIKEFIHNFYKDQPEVLATFVGLRLNI